MSLTQRVASESHCVIFQNGKTPQSRALSLMRRAFRGKRVANRRGRNTAVTCYAKFDSERMRACGVFACTYTARGVQ